MRTISIIGILCFLTILVHGQPAPTHQTFFE
jgi:hypothetical protein